MHNNYKFNTPNNEVILGYRKWIKGSQSRHLHDTYEVLFVVTGKRDMFIENKVIHMVGGDIVLIPPNILHKSFNNNDGSEIYSVYLKSIDNLSITNLSLFRSKTVQDIVYRIDREFKSNKIGSNLLIKSLGIELFIQILRRSINNGIYNIKIEDCNKTILQIVNYIKDKYQDDIGLDFLANKFNLSQGHLSRSFKKNTGFSIIDFINHIRILNSKILLLKTNNTISYICFYCGFGSLTNFGRLFKKLNGISPREYRKTLFINS